MKPSLVVFIVPLVLGIALYYLTESGAERGVDGKTMIKKAMVSMGLDNKNSAEAKNSVQNKKNISPEEARKALSDFIKARKRGTVHIVLLDGERISFRLWSGWKRLDFKNIKSGCLDVLNPDGYRYKQCPGAIIPDHTISSSEEALKDFEVRAVGDVSFDLVLS